MSSSTASLFNGATSPGQQVDLNVVPTKLIDRVETVSVGGAPIYGADAIAGTVNIILKKDFEGLDIDGQTGASTFHDAWNYRARALAGANFADRRGNITGVAEFYKSDGFVGPARPIVASDLGFQPPTSGPFHSVLTPNLTVPSVSTSGVPLLDDVPLIPAAGLTPALFGVTNAQGQALAFSPGSSALRPFNLGTPTGSAVFFQGGDGIRLSQFTNLLSPQKRGNIDALGNFKFTDHFGMFAEAWFSEEHATNLLTQPAYNTALFGFPAGNTNGNFKVSVNNPFLSSADQALIQRELTAYGANFPFGAPADPAWDGHHFYVTRANTDLQSGRAVVDQIVHREVLGINGDFALGARAYNWEIAANYGHSRDVNSTPSYVFQNVQNALNAVRDSSGNIVCGGTPVAANISSGSSTCAPLNIFGQGSPSAASLQYITHVAKLTSIDTQRDLTANLSGDVFKLPAGELKAAIGYEYRRETAAAEPDAYYTGNFGQVSVLPVSGGYHTNEIYLETLIPVFEPQQSLPALHQLELEGAVRRVKNSIAGSSTTWTGGLRWSPVRDLQFRGNKTHSIRAPAVTELFLPPSTNAEFANDPCDHRFVDQGADPATRRRNCQAAGIPSTFVSQVVSATATGTTAGNQDLTSETADSKTFGLVLRPRFITNFNLSIDYVEINLTNAIEQFSLTQVMDACYDSPTYPNDPRCSQFTRNTAHQVTNFHDGFLNAGLLDFQGITSAADWNISLPGRLGGLELRAAWLNTRKLRQQIGSAIPNNVLGDLAQTFAAAHGRGTFDVNYHRGPFQWYWQGQYIGPMNFSNQNTATSQDILSVGHWWIVNTTLSYALSANFEARLIVNNAFNKEPPYPALAGIGGNFASPTSLYFPGIIGRTYLVSAAYRF